jgi:hypothetical protein
VRFRVASGPVRGRPLLQVAVLVRLAHCCGSLGQWRWTAIVIPALAGMITTGCIGLEMAYFHSTSFVKPLVSSSPRPAAGSPSAAKSLVLVKVEDRRAGVAGYEVGSKYYGWYEASTIDLTKKARLADQVAQDAVAILSKQGYRAKALREVPMDSADVLLTIRIDVFSMLLLPGQDVHLDGLLVMEAVRPSDPRRWTDAVGARFECASSLYPSDAEFQRCFEQLYVSLREKMGDRLRIGFPALVTRVPKGLVASVWQPPRRGRL